MALATQCPHCGTMFRVASDQLKLRGGIVRCGACQEIFDGSATLVDLDKLPAKAPAAPQAAAAASPAPFPASSPPPAPDEAPVETTPAPGPVAVDEELPFVIVEPEGGNGAEVPDAQALPDTADFEGQPVYTLDFDHTFDPLGILPKVAPPDAGSDGAEAPQAVAEAEEPAGEAALPAPAPDTAPEAQQPAMADAATADSDIDPLSLLQPWSRPPQGADNETPPAPGDDVAAAPAAPADLPATQEEPPFLDTAVVEDEPAAAALAEQPAPPVHAAVAPDGKGRYEPAFGLPVDEELVATALPGHEPEPVASAAPQARPRAGDAPPLLTRESAASVVTPAPSAVPPAMRTPAAKRAEKAAARRSKLTPTKIEAQPRLRAAEIDEPEFVKRSRHQEQAGRTRRIAMLAGSIVLLLVLIAQGAITFRNAIAARFPAAKPALVSSCALLGCRVELPAQVDKLAIETGELTTLGGGAYSFTTELRNEAGTAQAWPSLELTLIDANDKPLARRVFPPRDYLAPETALANGMAPGAAQAIKLHFRVDDLKPSGYHIAVFYP